ncbi:MAG: tol-pal system protein YbgF [Gammaproteobacteria bacterium HGW-Gammaproteobacteria-14]|nr:MAG: tol-pal system protein YbgF [Gammaproteobacteria bacterium HGW-Gammaproteobacteria-14]
MGKRLVIGVLLSGLMTTAFGQGIGPLAVEDRVQANRGSQSSAVSDEALMMLMQQLQQYEQEIAMLRGQFEELRHEMDVMQRGERERYLDIDSRLNALMDGTARAGVGSGAVPASDAGVAPKAARPEDERAVYMAARELLNSSQFDKAATAFQQYLKDYPQGQFRDFSHFWLGEALRNAAKPDRDGAMEQFRMVVERFPESSRVPAALYRLAVLQAESGKTADARSTLNRVIQQHSTSSEAGYARTMLEQLK